MPLKSISRILKTPNLVLLGYLNQGMARKVVLVQNSPRANVIEVLEIPILLRSRLVKSAISLKRISCFVRVWHVFLISYMCKDKMSY